MKNILTLLSLIGLIATIPVHAAEPDYASLKAGLAKLLPDMKPDSIAPSPVPGLYEVAYGPQIFYATLDGKYLMHGSLIDVAHGNDLTEDKRSAGRLKAIDNLGEDRMIVFAPKNYTHTINVFTDIDCGYCRKLHSEIDQYEKLGIRVRYMLYPRTGVDSPSYDKAVSVWCAKDHNDALTRAKNNQTVEQKTCENPVKEHMALGDLVGVRGTPTIVTDSGEVMPGYVAASRLLPVLEGKAPAN
jgi:thiol:disulfide interchange protein DsbC